MQRPAHAAWPSGERPLGPAERASLVLRATLTMALFYLAALGLMLFCGAGVIVLFLVLLGAARFGLAGAVGPLLTAPVGVFGILARRMWLPSAPAYRVTLPPHEAPHLFDLIGALADRFALRPPSRVFVEMHGGAWVTMRGLTRRSGRTTLGIGFDLLAALTTVEVEAVLAHELAHARLVRWGLSRWLKNGLNRLSAVTNELVEFAEARRRAGAASDLAEGVERFFKPLTLRAARLVATYSRQDEFEADRLAAEVCGAAAVRAALTKVERLDSALQRMPWDERLARAHGGDDFTAWLVAELARVSDGAEAELADHSPDPFSTHPSMRDRLAALPPPEVAASGLRDAPGGATLLADPDAVARRLLGEIQRVVEREERRDTKRVAKEARRLDVPTRTTAGKFFGAILIGLGAILVLAAFGLGLTLELVATSVSCLLIGIGLYRFTGPGLRVPLPVPAFGTLSNRRRWDSREALHTEEQAIEAELRATATGRKRRRLRTHLAHARDALAAPDYLRVHVAARLARDVAPKSVDANLLYAIGAAALGIHQQAANALGAVRAHAGFRTLDVAWGAAWALSLLDSPLAEGFVLRLHRRRPEVATFAAMLARLQLLRGKVHSAIRAAETATRLEPSNRGIAILLANALLAAGRVREADDLLGPYAEDARREPPLAYLMVRTALMRRDLSRAREWADVIRSFEEAREGLLAVAHAFATARLDDIAAEFFTAALDAGYAPEANLGLATVARFRGDPVASRQHLLAALRAHDATFSEAASPAAVFQEVLAGLVSLAPHRTTCRAWIAAFPRAEMPLSERSLLVHAPTEADAYEHVREIVDAMQADGPPFDMGGVRWREVPQDEQPIRPVEPGVKGLVG